MSVSLPSFNPASTCAKCSGEDTGLVFHATAVVGWPCWPSYIVQERVFVPHLCKRCTRCGYAWVEAPADVEAYAQERPEEAPMSIRKTAAAGEVLGTEEAGIQKTAAADAPWAAEDEQDLAQENAAADQLGS